MKDMVSASGWIMARFPDVPDFAILEEVSGNFLAMK